MLLHHPEGCWLVDMPYIHTKQPPNGAGDLTAALLLANILKGDSPESVLSSVASAVFGIFEFTVNSGKRELQVVAAQNELAHPTHLFKVTKLP
jgi:pyridoxine kinase